MSNLQFFTALFLPMLFMMAGFWFQLNAINGLRADFRADLNQFRVEVNARFVRIEDRIDVLTGKVAELDNRLTKLEVKLGERN